MATKERARSKSGFYHIFQRGVNHFNIFESTADRKKYLHLLSDAARRFDIEIHSWCLMSNHTHLLLRGLIEDISSMMQLLGSRYAKYFNSKYERCGALFGSRFSSISIDTEKQLLSVVRYIHRNPCVHGDANQFRLYRWSSFKEFISNVRGLCTTKFVLSLFKSINEFDRFHNSHSDHMRQLDLHSIGRLLDKDAIQRANALLKDSGIMAPVSHIGRLDSSIRDKAIALIFLNISKSLLQIQRLTSVALRIIESAIETSKRGTWCNLRDFKQLPVMTKP